MRACAVTSGRAADEDDCVPRAAAKAYAVAGIGLLCAALIAGAPFIGLPDHVYLALILAAVVPSLVGHTLLNWSVRRTPTHLVSLAILGEPVGASLLTWIFFAEAPPAHAAVGGAVILAGIVVGFAKKSTRASAAAPGESGRRTS